MKNKFLVAIISIVMLVSLSGAEVKAEEPELPQICLIENPQFVEDTMDILMNSKITKILNNKDINIVLAGSDSFLESSFGFPAAIGCTDFETRTVYIESVFKKNLKKRYLKYGVSKEKLRNISEEELNKRSIRSTLLHEIGHVIDEFTYSQTYDFAVIYLNDVQQYKQTTEYSVDSGKIYNNINTPLEYFASAFACYILYPEELKLYCNATWTYFENVMSIVNMN